MKKSMKVVNGTEGKRDVWGLLEPKGYSWDG